MSIAEFAEFRGNSQLGNRLFRPPAPLALAAGGRYTEFMFYLASPDGQQQLLAYLKAWVKWTTLLPALMPLGAMIFLAFLAALLSVPAGEAADIILKGLVESYISLAVPVTQFWIAAYLLAAMFFVTGWESARPASWRLPLLFLLPWYRRPAADVAGRQPGLRPIPG